jgi:molecular chaperone DnaK (HSP70)
LLDQKLSEHSANWTTTDIVQRNQTEERVPVASLEVNQNKLAVWLGFKKTLGSGQHVFGEVIPAGTALPCEAKELLTTVHDQQTAVDQQIYLSNTGSADLGEAEYLGNIEILDIEPMMAGEPTFETVFSVDTGGALYVKTYHQDSQFAYKASFSLSQPYAFDSKVSRWRDKEGRFTRAPEEIKNLSSDREFEKTIEDDLQQVPLKKHDWTPLKETGSVLNLNTSGALTLLIIIYGVAILGIAGSLVYSLITAGG